jgi:hypothetical protein
LDFRDGDLGTDVDAASDKDDPDAFLRPVSFDAPFRNFWLRTAHTLAVAGMIA